MLIKLCKSKIHRATITESDVHYEGSITLDSLLMEAAGIVPNEIVQVVNINNGARFETYVIKGAKGSGDVGLNGAAARLGVPGDLIIVISYGYVEAEQALKIDTKIVHVDGKNHIRS
ncbi:MAG: aspartate 1-decarboxylase [Elusimicrobia bacterium]|nr:aspartate 1-decarboxylase [Elusimicrobiota bacterium]MBD3411564.1 aspartate 1-decarboxylase [Elusimicrobiota bacterium]